MEKSFDRLFLDYSVNKLNQLAARIETCLGKLSEEQVWARGSESENAIGNLALHVCGNVRQWIVTSVGGQADVRDRDAEFAARGGLTVADLSQRLRRTMEEAAATINAVSPARLSERLVIQKYDVTVLEAIYHVVEHFSMHAGQIMFATKMLTGDDLGFYSQLRLAAAHDDDNTP
jgi:uncharacterized damage-inducible protein DinB